MNIKITLLIFLLLSVIPLLSSEPGEYQDPYSFNGTSSIPLVKKGSSLKKSWYREAVIYQVFVRAFYDSDGDGIGDLPGLISKLEYLEELGVRGLWLMPVTSSYDRDHGYSVMDYRQIEQDYGTMDDFDNLVKECHKRGIAIIMDIVVNHISSFSPQFEDAKNNPEGPYRDWFIFSETLQEWQEPWSGVYVWSNMNIEAIDRDFNRYIWWKDNENSFYYGLFAPIMPDLNYNNREVYQFMKDNIAFWMERGVDGLRIDAARHIFEDGPDLLTDHPLNHSFFKGIRKLLDRYDNRFMVVEADNIEYLGDGSNESHAYFDFDFSAAVTRTILSGNKEQFTEQLEKWKDLPDGGLAALPLSNHDWFLGHRSMSRYNGNLDKGKLAASILLTLPGIPFVYYGEEIGMVNSRRYEFDWNLRSPMQWDSTRNSGFTTAEWPYNRRVNRGYKKCNVSVLESDPGSILAHYRELIDLRNRQRALSRGSVQLVDLHPSLLAWNRTVRNESVVVIHNITSDKVKIALTFEGLSISESEVLFGEEGDDYHVSGNGSVIIRPWKSIIVKTEDR
jgi:alpha-amylase